MRVDPSSLGLFTLPASLILLIAAQITPGTAEQQEPHQAHLRPTAIRKISPDREAKFFPGDFAFAPLPEATSFYASRDLALSPAENALLSSNNSAPLPPRPAYAMHHPPSLEAEPPSDTAPEWELFRRAAARALSRLQRRQWACPTGRTSCASIGHPNSCCLVGETCYEVRDTGLGPVGCCAPGAKCDGNVLQCAAGDVSCPSSMGGGCCLKGYACAGVGCVPSSAASPSASPTTITTTSTTVLPTQQGSTVVVTVVITQTPSNGPPTTLTTTQTTTLPSSPPPTAETITTSPATGNGAVRPVPTEGYCPTGFYPCLARAGGGCCQTGRDCATTNCPPPPASTTVVDKNGVTVVVPVGGAQETPKKDCAQGWFLCGAEAGPVAGCCPSGYACGTASCSTAGPSGTGAAQKVFPGSGAETMRARRALGLTCFGAAALTLILM